MTKELLFALFRDDIFQYGLLWGCFFGVIISVIITILMIPVHRKAMKGGKKE